ncbi:MAG: hypothetical protein J0M12_08710 [Deltaproteobacteria bacterium]|nr:hypothetical protein [Deltaproteobacteria bacterium]
MDERMVDNSKPSTVTLAVQMLWVSLAVGLAKLILDQARISTQAPVWFVNFILVFGSLFLAFLILKISAGKNWARITFLALFVGGLIPAFPIILKEFSTVPAVGALSVLQAGLQGYALFLLFASPGSAWFGKVKRASV